MKTLTFGTVELGVSHAAVSTPSGNVGEHDRVVCTFTSEDYIQNAAHVHMTPAEARRIAMLLIGAAHKIDPIEAP